MITPRDEPGLDDVAAHYDDLDRWYREIWGEHVHHGLWLEGSESVEQATVQLIDRLVSRLRIGPGDRVCDAGCGYGGTARVLAREYGAVVTGVTLSEAQWRFAQEQAAGRSNPRYVLGDFCQNIFDTEAFDAAIAIESSEHMPDKQACMSELFRIVRPGGRAGIFAWLSKEQPAPWEVRYLLEPICREGRLPGMGTQREYLDMLSAAGFEKITFEECTSQVKRTWPIIVGRLFKRLFSDAEAWRFLLHGPADRVFLRTIFRIWAAYETGSMRYGLFIAHKPGAERMFESAVEEERTAAALA